LGLVFKEHPDKSDYRNYNFADKQPISRRLFNFLGVEFKPNGAKDIKKTILSF
jgi:hypothetical protein